MGTKYIITKSDFLAGWSVVSPSELIDWGAGPTWAARGVTKDSHQEAVDWMLEDAAEQFEKFYATHTAAEPAY